MTIALYDLAAANPKLMFSPFSWRTRMVLLHKDLPFEVIPWRFSDRSATKDSGHNAIPVIRDGDRWVGDSWEIALYLDEHYPQKPVMKDAESRAAARLMMGLCGSLVFPAAIRIAVYQAYKILDDACKPYFRESREAMFGRTLEEIHADEDSAKAGLAQALTPFAETLGDFEYIGGDEPAYSDYVLFGLLKWIDIVSEYPAIDLGSPVGMWFTRLQNRYDAYAANVPTVRSLNDEIVGV